MSSRLGPGSQVAGYRVQSLLGEGGMGIVYLAERPEGGLCALKVLAPTLGKDPTFVVRFKREAEYAEAIDNPNILKLYGAGEDGGLPWFAMEYVRGVDLKQQIARDGVLTPKLAVHIVDQVGSALDAAHARGLIHRDIKPGNIMVAEDGDPKAPHCYLTDFGLSKNPSQDSVALTQQGQFVGTTAYTAPEEILAQPRDHRVDIYSLGCVLYEELVGIPPFVRDRDLDVLYAHIGDPRPRASEYRPDLPAGLDEVIQKAMAIAPDDRYASCAEMIASARATLTGVPTESQPPLAPPGFRLVIESGPAVGREINLDGHELELGRLVTLDGALAGDREISRRHGRVFRAADGAWLVEDLGSANGTWVNDTRIGGPHPLHAGDELRVGVTTMRAVGAAEPDEEAPAPTAPPPPVEGVTSIGDRPLPPPPPEPDLPPPPPDPSELSAAPPPEASDLSAAPPVPDAVPPLEDPPPTEKLDVTAPLAAAPAPEPAPAGRVVLRVEVDLDTGAVGVEVEEGPAVRVVPDGGGWRIEPA